MQILSVETKSHTYPIYIGHDLIKNSILKTHITHDQVMVVTNETIAPLYLQQVKQSLLPLQCDTVILKDGEQYKNLETLNLIFDQLLMKKHHRTTTLIALGGGVIGDMVGFAAACYQRGVNFIQIPTSLLAQVDASVGGKTAVNHALGKNMIGAFYQPQCVIIDMETLRTLPTREYNSGIAEIIKHGLIADVAFFHWLELHIIKLKQHDPLTLQKAISRCCEIKAKIVAEDETEANVRALLNFGHTIGHVIENIAGYGNWLHGEAVAVGMVAAAKLSRELGFLSSNEVLRIIDCLKYAQLPVNVNQPITITQCKSVMALDKKILDHSLRFILLRKLGEAFIINDVNETVLDKVLLECGFV